MSLEKVKERYSRQTEIYGLPDDFQKILMNSSVLLLGAGGLGCPASIYLAAAGIGKITIVDRDKIAASNLNRQILYTPEDIDKEKAVLCAERIHKQNPDCQTAGLCTEITGQLLDKLMPEHDIVLDLCDNYPTRRIIASACHKHSKRSVIAAVYGLEGFVIATDRHSACFGCIYPREVKPRQIPPRVIGPVAGNMGTLAAVKCMLALCGAGTYGVMHCMDFINTRAEEITVLKNDNCLICGK